MGIASRLLEASAHFQILRAAAGIGASVATEAAREVTSVLASRTGQAARSARAAVQFAKTTAGAIRRSSGIFRTALDTTKWIAPNARQIAAGAAGSGGAIAIGTQIGWTSISAALTDTVVIVAEKVPLISAAFLAAQSVTIAHDEITYTHKNMETLGLWNSIPVAELDRNNTVNGNYQARPGNWKVVPDESMFSSILRFVGLD